MGGGWIEPFGYKDITIYYWIYKLSYAFFLVMFVAFSGYIYAFQFFTKRKDMRFLDFAKTKFKRLIIPSILFSIVYVILFYNLKDYNPFRLTMAVLSGAGHMWFLPMLFWCFLGGWLLVRWNISDKIKFLFLLSLSLMSFLPIPLQVGRAMYYLLFFYLGVWSYKRKNEILQVPLSRIYLTWVIFVVTFIVVQLIRRSLVFDTTLVGKVLSYELYTSTKLIYATIGLFALFYTSLAWIQHHLVSTLCVKLSGYCFGVYLFQQFILELLYYKTSTPDWVGPYWLPWIGFILAMTVSLIATNLLLRTKIGHLLIG